MSTPTGVSVFVPALNEEKNLSMAVRNILSVASSTKIPIEIIIINDGSTDKTAEIINELEKNYPSIRSVHHERNRGWGVSFQEAVGLAMHPKIALYPGDGMVSEKTLHNMVACAVEADFVCAYTVNKECRSKFRNRLSSLYTLIYVLTFRIPLRYINATPVYPVEILRRLKIGCRRYSFPSEVTVKIMRTGCRFMEIPGYHNPINMKSSALRIKNLLEVVQTYFRLVWEIYIGSRGAYSRPAVRVATSHKIIS